MQKVREQLAALGQAAGQPRQQVVNEVVTPLHEAVTRVHLEHHRSLVAAQRALPRRTPEEEWVSAAGIALSAEQLADVVDGIREALSSRSEEHEVIRHKVRAEAGELLRRVEGDGEKRYVLSIIHYFLEEHYIAPSPDIMDTLVKEIESRGGLRAVHSPASRVIMQLDATADADYLRVALHDAIASLNEGFTEVCAWHATLRRDVMNEGRSERREKR